MNWPAEIAPFAVQLISLGKNKEAEAIYQELSNHSVEVLFDDREISAGEKFAEADLVGCLARIIVSEKSLAAGGAEISIKDQTEILSTEKILDKVIHSRDNIIK